MNFANVKSLVIPEGSVTQIADSLGTVLWKAVTGPDYTEPFYVENIRNSDEALRIIKSNSNAPTISIEYSTDKTNWSTLGDTSTSALTHVLHPGDKLYLRATTDVWSTAGGRYINRINGISRVGGNVMSLLYGSNFTGQETSFPVNSVGNFNSLLTGNTTLLDASKLLLPATTLTSNCYGAMFYGCTSLTTAPALSVTTLAERCYDAMFYGCTSLTTAPTLPATTLANSCYSSMFYGCTSLTIAPELPATTLVISCYASMFGGCTSLTTAPTLPATTLANSCYSGMFYGCSSLTTAPTLPATTLANSCYDYMFQGCTSLTTAPTLPATTLANSCYGSMFYGCSSLTAAPELPATTLVDSCYESMFSYCSNLAYIKCLATNISASSCLSSWVDGVAASGTFVASYDGAQYDIWAYGVDGVPQGWSAEDEYGTPFTPRISVQYDDQYINVTNLGVTANTYDSNVGTYVWPFQDVTGTDYESYKPSGTPIFLGDVTSTSDSERTFKAIVTGKDEYIDSIEISVSSRDDSGSTWDYVIDVYDENGNQLATLGDYQQQTLTVSFQNYLSSSEHLYIYVKSYSTDNGYRPMFGITSVTNA